MSNVREVLFKVERDESQDTNASVMFVSTSFDRAIQWARDNRANPATVCVVGYTDADVMDFGFSPTPVLVWRRVYDISNGESIAVNMTESETRRADAMREWCDEVEAAATYV